MKPKVLFLLAILAGCSGTPIPAHAQLASPYSNSLYPAQTFTATGQTGTPIQLNGLTSSSTVGSAFAAGTISLSGSSLTTVTFAIQGSSDNGGTYYPLPIYTVATPTASPTNTVTATGNGIYQVPLLGITHVRFVTSGTFTATNVSLTLTASPNAQLAKGATGGAPSGPAGGVLTGTYPNPSGLAATAVTPGSYTNMNATITADGRVTAASNGTESSFPSGASEFAANDNTNTPTVTSGFTYDQANLHALLGSTATSPKAPLVMCSFGEQAASSTTLATLFISVSTDGVNWQVISTGYSGLGGEQGRDWSCAKYGNIYYTVYSPSAGLHTGAGFGIAYSYDLVHWVSMSHVLITGTNPMVGNTWAPDFFIENPGCTTSSGTSNRGYPCTGAEALEVLYADGPGTFSHNVYKIKALNATLNSPPTSWGNEAGTANAADLIFNSQASSIDAIDPHLAQTGATTFNLLYVNDNSACTSSGATSCNIQYVTASTPNSFAAGSGSSGDWTGYMGTTYHFWEAPSLYTAGVDTSGNTITRLVMDPVLPSQTGLVYIESHNGLAGPWNAPIQLVPPIGIFPQGQPQPAGYRQGTVMHLYDLDTERDIANGLATITAQWVAAGTFNGGTITNPLVISTAGTLPLHITSSSTNNSNSDLCNSSSGGQCWDEISTGSAWGGAGAGTGGGYKLTYDSALNHVISQIAPSTDITTYFYPLALPTGSTAPTQPSSDSTTELATTAFVHSLVTGDPGTVTYTTSQTASISDDNKLVIMNCPSACVYTLPTTQPSATWSTRIVSQGATLATIALGGPDTFNGSTSVPALNAYRIMPVWANSAVTTDYSGEAPLLAGTNINLTPATNKLTIAATGGGGTGALTQLAQAVVSGTSTTSVTFSAISGSYSGLRVTSNAQSASASQDDLQWRFNGDTGSNYDTAGTFSNSSSGGNAAYYTLTAQTSGGNASTVPPSSTSRAESGECVIMGYAGTAFQKQLNCKEGGWNGTVNQHIDYGLDWRNTAAVTSITIFLNSGSHFVAGTTFTLYGMQ